jgi:hypothetical protein
MIMLWKRTKLVLNERLWHDEMLNFTKACQLDSPEFGNFGFKFVISMLPFRDIKKYMSKYLLCLIFFFLMFGLNAQQSLNNTPVQRPDYKLVSDIQADEVNKIYVQHVNIADELINGREYIPYYFKCKEKPLYNYEVRRTGSVILNGRRYDNLLLEYDTYLDQLIYSDFKKLINDQIFKIALNKDIVSGFSMNFGSDSVIFRNFRAETDPGFNLADGFYEVVYEGRSKFIIRHQSVLVESEGLYEYRYTPLQYVSAGGNFVRVKTASGFRKIFGDRADAVRKYMRLHSIRFSTAGKGELAAIMKYYDSLITPSR